MSTLQQDWFYIAPIDYDDRSQTSASEISPAAGLGLFSLVTMPADHEILRMICVNPGKIGSDHFRLSRMNVKGTVCVGMGVGRMINVSERL